MYNKFALLVFIIFITATNSRLLCWPSAPTFQQGCMIIRDFTMGNSGTVINSLDIRSCATRTGSITAVVKSGQTYPFTSKAGCNTSGVCNEHGYLYIWIDFNADGDFSDPGELVYNTLSSTENHSGNITIPSILNSETTLMRAVFRWWSNGSPNYTGSQFGYGDYADFTVQINVDPHITTGAISSSAVCPGSGVSVPFTLDQTEFLAGNVFTAQLSDANGNFANAVDIGSIQSTTQSSINCLIPSNTAPGNAYKIRVVSSNPITTGIASTNTLTVYSTPTAVINGSGSVCSGSLNTYFANTSSSYQYQWSAIGGQIQGSGSSSSAQVIWGDAGEAKLSLVVSDINSGCRDTSDLYVTINPNPTATISGESNVCENTQTQYSTPQISGWSNKWSVSGSGSIIGSTTGSTVQVKWGNSGQSQIHLAVKNTTTNCTDSASFNVTVRSIPQVQVSGDNSVCLGDTVLYQVLPAESANLYSLNWTASKGLLAGVAEPGTMRIYWNSAGAGWVQLEAAYLDGSCPVTIKLPITINSLPQPRITGDTLVYYNSTVKYQSNSTSSISNYWEVSGGIIQGGLATEKDIFVRWGSGSEGSISLTQQTNSTGCSSKITQHISLRPNQQGLITGANQTCLNSAEEYSTDNNPAYSYLWSVQGAVIQGDNSKDKVIIKFTKAGQVTITLVRTLISVSAKDTTQITVLVYPLPEVSLKEISPICENISEITLSGGMPAGGFYGGDSVKSNGKIYPSLIGAGKYRINYTYTDTNGCSATAYQLIYINEMPSKPKITRNNDVLASSYSYGNQWYFNGAIINGASNQFHKPVADGFYQVQFKDSAGCESPLSDPYNYKASSVYDLSGSDLTVFPNPAENDLKILSADPIHNIAIYNTYGMRLLERLVYENNNNVTININYLTSGCYLLEIRTAQSSVRKMIVVEK